MGPLVAEDNAQSHLFSISVVQAQDIGDDSVQAQKVCGLVWENEWVLMGFKHYKKWSI